MFAALRHMLSLPAEPRAVFRSKLVQGRYPIDRLISLLTPLADADRIGDAGRASLRRGLFGSFFGMVLLPLGAAFANGNAPAFAKVLLIGAAACAVVLVVLIALRLWLGRFDDVENNLRNVALPFLSALQEDVADHAELDVRIDFSRAVQKSKLDRVEKPARQGFNKLVNSYYISPWFEGSAPLATGGRLRWRVTDHVLSSQRTRRSASGKYKVKTKQKRKSKLDVSLLRPARHYGPSDPADPCIASDDGRVEARLDRKIALAYVSGQSSTALIDGLIDLTALAFTKIRPLRNSSDTGATP
jgi:hypothetical protein